MDGKRYYWLRLQKDFFTSKRVKKMRRLPNGDTLAVIYLEMQLLAIENDGLIVYTGLEDSVAEEIALDLNEEAEDVSAVIEYGEKTGLCEIVENGLFLPFAAESVGSEGNSARRMRTNREKCPPAVKNAQCADENAQCADESAQCADESAQCADESAQCADDRAQCDGEKEIEIEKESEIERELERGSGRGKRAPSARTAPARHKYGQYENVLLSDQDIEKLKAEYPGDWEARIERLSEYMASKGVKYKNHLATIRAWARDDAARDGPKKAAYKPVQGENYIQQDYTPEDLAGVFREY